MSQDPESQFEFIASSGGIEHYRFKANGLNILLKRDTSYPVVAVMVSYLAGSRNEQVNKTGLAHVLEHMMFKGSENYHAGAGKAAPDLLERTGAILNANTGYDSTNYFELVPDNELELALDIESDRMRNLLLKEEDFAHEKQVILNELERYFDSPVTRLVTSVWTEAFRVHPYGNPIIGERADVKALSTQDLKEFYETYYWPENAFLTLVGNFEKPAVLQMIRKKFGAISRPPHPAPSVGIEEPEQTEPRSVTLNEEGGSEYVLLANRMPGALDKDAVALDVLAMVLGTGKTSRLYQRLVESGLAVSVETSTAGTRDPGLFSTLVTLSPEASHEAIQKEIREAYEKLRNEGISATELEKAKEQVRAEIAFSRDGALSVASQLSLAVAVGDWRNYADYQAAARSVTLEDVSRVAQKYLREETSTSGFVKTRESAKPVSPVPAPGEAASGHTQISEAKSSGQTETDPAVTETVAESSPVPQVSTHYGDRVELFKAGHAALYLLETGGEDIVTLTGSMGRAGAAYAENPVLAGMVTWMLDKGTKQRSKQEIASLLEKEGARISFQTDEEYVRFTALFLKEDTRRVLGLLAEQLKRPAFEKEEFEKMKTRFEIGIRQARASTRKQGKKALMRSIFPENHPRHELSFDEQLEKVRRTELSELEAFHESHFGTQQFQAVAVGGPDKELLKAAFREAFSEWPAQERPAAALPEPEQIKAVFRQIPVPGKTKLDVFWGRSTGLTRRAPDFLPAYVANYILGGDFTARLSHEVREKSGLTYGIQSGLVGATERMEAAWLVHMIVNPSVLNDAVEKVHAVLENFYHYGVEETELKAKKRTLSGRFQVQLSNTQGVAAQLLRILEWGFKADYMDRFPGLVHAVELDQVNDVIRRYYNPEKLHRVIAGNVPESEREEF